jgi:hypothetical protein
VQIGFNFRKKNDFFGGFITAFSGFINRSQKKLRARRRCSISTSPVAVRRTRWATTRWTWSSKLPWQTKTAKIQAIDFSKNPMNTDPIGFLYTAL